MSSFILYFYAVVRTVRNTFDPLDCGVEVFDSDQKLRFRVFNLSGKPVLRASQVLMRRAREPDGLRYIIKSARDRLKSRGYTLEPSKKSK